jgi:GNAT superfamily N-acetyltransferase
MNGFVDAATPVIAIATTPAARGQGLGTRLLEALAREARRTGFPALSLSVGPSNPAMRLYARLGFVPLEPAQGLVRMRLDLR